MADPAIIECIRLCEPLKLGFFLFGVLNFGVAAILGFIGQKMNRSPEKNGKAFLLVSLIMIIVGFTLIIASQILVPYIVQFVTRGDFTVTPYTCTCPGRLGGE